MDIDDDEDMNSTLSDESSICASDIEWDLDHIDEYDNVKQLALLKMEINHFMIHGITPHDEWFDERYKFIDTYSKLNWSDIAKKYHNRDEYMHDAAIFIIHCLDELVEERATKPTFNLRTYYNVIHAINSIWKYFKETYLTDEEDEDIDDLIIGLTNLDA